MSVTRLLAVLTTLLVITALTTFGQRPQPSLPRRLSVDVDVVLVNATVTDSHGHYLSSLEKDRFRVWEDRIEQRLEYFSSEDIPQSVGILLDVSGSMENTISVAQQAALKFLQMGNREDEFFLIEFSDRPKVSSDFTTNVGRLERQLIATYADGNTALYDALYLGLQKASAGRNPRKALLLITDGEDNWSRYRRSEVRELLKESDVQLYAIGIESWAPHHNSHTADRDPRMARAVLEELSDMSGGRSFFTTSLAKLDDICTRIATELHSQYVLGYVPTNTNKDGRWRKISLSLEVTKDSPRMHVRTKQGYYAPGRL
jgi:Ca-activated chloride channel homolog